MSRCLIFGALATERLPIDPQPGDLVIAADRGFDRAAALGIHPDLVVGDYDSLGRTPDFSPRIDLPVRKDLTDMAKAVETAFDRGYREFHIFGAAGGKLDHTVANIQIAGDLAERGAWAVFYGPENFTVIRDGGVSFSPDCRGRISVFSLSERSQGVTISGLSYELTDGELSALTPLGVSNEFTGRPARISVNRGRLLIVWQDQTVRPLRRI